MKKVLLIAACVVGMGLVGRADFITITPGTIAQWTGISNDNPNTADVANKVGYSGTLYQLYKMDVGATAAEGSYAGSYSTVFVPPSEPGAAMITWGGGSSSYIQGNPLYLVVKDGNHEPYWYIFDLLNLTVQVNGAGNLQSYSWNGTDEIRVEGFWPAGGAISHVDIVGVAVPDNGLTAAMLGLGVLGVGYMARRKS